MQATFTENPPAASELLRTLRRAAKRSLLRDGPRPHSKTAVGWSQGNYLPIMI